MAAEFGAHLEERRKGQNAMVTVADNIVKTLKTSGVRRIYGLPGDSLNGFTDALRRDGDIEWSHWMRIGLEGLRRSR